MWPRPIEAAAAWAAIVLHSFHSSKTCLNIKKVELLSRSIPVRVVYLALVVRISAELWIH